MRKICDSVRSLLRDEQGMETVEWGVMAALIVAALVTAIGRWATTSWRSSKASSTRRSNVARKRQRPGCADVNSASAPSANAPRRRTQDETRDLRERESTRGRPAHPATAVWVDWLVCGCHAWAASRCGARCSFRCGRVSVFAARIDTWNERPQGIEAMHHGQQD